VCMRSDCVVVVTGATAAAGVSRCIMQAPAGGNGIAAVLYAVSSLDSLIFISNVESSAITDISFPEQIECCLQGGNNTRIDVIVTGASWEFLQQTTRTTTQSC
jgi:hypothetical protein